MRNHIRIFIQRVNGFQMLGSFASDGTVSCERGSECATIGHLHGVGFGWGQQHRGASLLGSKLPGRRHGPFEFGKFIDNTGPAAERWLCSARLPSLPRRSVNGHAAAKLIDGRPCGAYPSLNHTNVVRS
ncbi:hypothetical protein ACW7BC_18285 [Azospirillum argentinense]